MKNLTYKLLILSFLATFYGCSNIDYLDSQDLGDYDGSSEELLLKERLPAHDKKIKVSNITELKNAVREANKTGEVDIVLDTGTYELDSILLIRNNNITITSQNGNRDDVIIKGKGMYGNLGFIFVIFGDHVTIANLTLGWVRYHGIQVRGEDDADNALIHNVRIVDTREQMLKVSYQNGNPSSADNGIVRHCLFEYSAGIGPQYYIGGIDAHNAHGWLVIGNEFRHIKSPVSTLAEHAIHFWTGSSNTTILGNRIIDCDRGIGLGLGTRPHGSGKIYNNMVYTTRDVGIGLENADGIEVYHNTVVSENYPFSIEYRFSGTHAVIKNNITSGAIQSRDGGVGVLSSNITGADTLLFIDHRSGDLHINKFHPDADSVINKADYLLEVRLDFDNQRRPRGYKPDIGADEVM